MGAARRLHDDGVDDPEFEEILGGYLHIRRGVFGARGIPPKDRSRGFRRGDSVDRMFEHQDAVAACDRYGAAGAAFAENDGDARHARESEASVARAIASA